MEKVDTLIKTRWVAPVVPAGGALADHAVAIRQGRIVDLLPSEDALERYEAAEIIDRPGHLLIPGLVNAHTHASMTLLRGLADDLALMDWLQNHIWPAEQRWMSAEFVEHGAELAMAEMLLGGTTTFNDMYFFPEVVARSAARIGMRACVGMILIKFPTVWASDPAEYLRKGWRCATSTRAIRSSARRSRRTRPTRSTTNTWSRSAGSPTNSRSRYTPISTRPPTRCSAASSIAAPGRWRASIASAWSRPC
jgi:cytosine/adenosine deaminase-related metal-dependent hydrolase